MKAPYSRTLFELLCEQAEKSPDTPVVISAPQRASYADLVARASRVANGMRDHGIKRGDRVGLLSDNRVEWLEILFAASALGATVVPFSTWSTARELEYMINDSCVRWLFLIERFGEQNFLANLSALKSAKKVPLLQECILIDGAADGEASYGKFQNSHALPPLPPGEGASAVDTLFVLYTSGSSNRPKAVPLVHYAAIENAFNIGERQGLVNDDRVLVSVPLFWAYGAINALPAVVSHGATLVLQSHFEAGGALQLIEEHKCTGIYTLPAMTNALLSHPDFRRHRTTSLRTGVMLGTPQDIKRTATELGVRDICNIYGGTECYGNCCVTPHDWPLEKRATVQGLPLPGVTIRIRESESGALLPNGQVGAIEVRGYLTPGYDGGSSSNNAEAFTQDGFFRTGDLGWLDEEGAIHFSARGDEVIKRSGINVAPAEVEDILQQHHDVAIAGVTGTQDAKRGEIIVAFVVPKPGHMIDREGVLAYCREHISSYKIPDRLVVAERLPLTVTGKLMRRELKALASQPADDGGGQ